MDCVGYKKSCSALLNFEYNATIVSDAMVIVPLPEAIGLKGGQFVKDLCTLASP